MFWFIMVYRCVFRIDWFLSSKWLISLLMYFILMGCHTLILFIFNFIWKFCQATCSFFYVIHFIYFFDGWAMERMSYTIRKLYICVSYYWQCMCFYSFISRIYIYFVIWYGMLTMWNIKIRNEHRLLLLLLFELI